MGKSEPRELLARADHERRMAAAADSLRCTIRLGRPVQVGQMIQVGPFGWKRKYLYELEDRLPPAAVDALYRALGVVMAEANEAAAELEGRVRADG